MSIERISGAALGGAADRSLQSIMSTQTDEQLARLEDELNFEHFTGVPSPMMLEIVAQVCARPSQKAA